MYDLGIKNLNNDWATTKSHLIKTASALYYNLRMRLDKTKVATGKQELTRLALVDQ